MSDQLIEGLNSESLGIGLDTEALRLALESKIGRSMPLCLYLIRHGETAWSLSGRHTGLTDIALTAHGEDQARELAQRLHGISFAHVLTSPLQRARRTSELAGLAAADVIVPDLAEWNYGDYEGQRSVDIRKQRAGWNVFRDGCPNGEMPAQVTERADRLIVRLRALEGNVALFSHGQFGCVLAARWIGLPLVEAQHFAFGPAAVSILGYDPHHPEVAVIAMWNCAPNEIRNEPANANAGDAVTVKQGAIQRWENEGGEIQSGSSTTRLKNEKREEHGTEIRNDYFGEPRRTQLHGHDNCAASLPSPMNKP